MAFEYQDGYQHGYQDGDPTYVHGEGQYAMPWQQYPASHGDPAEYAAPPQYTPPTYQQPPPPQHASPRPQQLIMPPSYQPPSHYDAPLLQQPYGKPPGAQAAGSAGAPSLVPPPTSNSRLPAHRSATPLLPMHQPQQQPLQPHQQQPLPQQPWQQPQQPHPQPQQLAYPSPSSLPSSELGFPPPPPSSYARQPERGASYADAAGRYRRSDPDNPRGIGRGQYAEQVDSRDFLRDGSQFPRGSSSSGGNQSGKSRESVASRVGVHGPDGLLAKQHNADSLEHFMGGVGGSNNEARLHYGSAHAGKSVASHLKLSDSGIEGPSDGLDPMLGMRHYHNQATSGKLQVRPEVGFAPGVPSGATEAAEPARGLRAQQYKSQESCKDHVQASLSGLTTDIEKPVGRRHNPCKANASHIALGPGGLSTKTDGEDFPAGMRCGGPHKASYSQFVQKDEGITQGGVAPRRHNPFAGKTSQSHLVNDSWEYKAPVGSDGLPAPAKRPAYAGKTSSSHLSYQDGGMSVADPPESMHVRVRGDPARWSTTYDSMNGRA